MDPIGKESNYKNLINCGALSDVERWAMFCIWPSKLIYL
jgi:hypothetical protein